MMAGMECTRQMLVPGFISMVLAGHVPPCGSSSTALIAVVAVVVVPASQAGCCLLVVAVVAVTVVKYCLWRASTYVLHFW
jgi:hypothetical protein